MGNVGSSKIQGVHLIIRGNSLENLEYIFGNDVSDDKAQGVQLFHTLKS